MQPFILLRFFSKVRPPKFKHAEVGVFFQEKPVLCNPYLADSLLKSFLKKNIPAGVRFLTNFQKFKFSNPFRISRVKEHEFSGLSSANNL